MGQLAYQVAGAAVGFFVGGPTGAQYGWAIGGVVGGVISPPKGADGPRLGDLTVQSSTYGQPIARLWGTQRLAGNIIWATPLVEQENEQGGKGGSSYSTFSYSCSFAIGLCRGTIDGITRIWADGKLIYNIRPENEGPQQGFVATSMTVYTGSEAQEVDPTIQAHVGDTPAYRGLAYVVFAGLQLEKFGNRIPNLTFEVVSDGVEAMPEVNTFGEQYMGYTFQHDMASDGSLWISTLGGHHVPGSSEPNQLEFVGAGIPQVQRYNPVTQALEYAFDCPLETHLDDFGDPQSYYPIAGYGICYGDRYFVGRGKPGPVRLTGESCPPPYPPCAKVNPFTHGWSFGVGTAPIRFVDEASSGQFQNAFYWPSVAVIPDYEAGYVYWMGENGVAGGFGVGFYQNGTQKRAGSRCACNPGVPNSIFDGIAHRAPDWVYAAVRLNSGAIMQGNNGGSSFLSYDNAAPVLTGDLTATSWQLPGSSVVMPAAIYDPARSSLWVFAGDDFSRLYNYGAYQGYTFPAIPGEAFGERVRGGTVDAATGNLRLLMGGGFGDTPRLVLFNPDTQTIIESRLLTGTTVANANGKLYDLPGQRRVIYADGYKIYSIPYGNTLDPVPVLLSTVVTDISLDAGLTEAEIDVTELTDLVLGYTITRQGSARSAIEQLMSAYTFDAVESDGKVKFVKRGKPPVMTIADDDLAAHTPSQPLPVPLALTRADEADLPRVVAVRYINPDNDYQPGVQSARRQTGRATAEQVVDVPVVLADAAAKALADAALYSAWTARTAAKWATSLAYADLEPTDVVEISGNPILVTKVSRAGNILQFEGVFDSGQLLTAGAVAGSVYEVVAADPVVVGALTALQLLDVPLVADADEGPGYYAAVRGYGTPWAGAAITKSDDAGGSFAVIDSSSVAAVVGAADDALGDFSRNLFDEFNAVTVSLLGGTLSSATEAAVLNGANVALLGRELLQFKRATLNDDGSYTLSGLLRGRAGSPTAGHIAGDRFVLMNAAVRRIAGSAAEIGLPRQYKGVSFGGTYESAAAVYFTNTAQGLECLSPVLLGGGRDAAGNLTIHWTRRTRLDGQWRDAVDAGLGEPAENYEVEIYETASYITLLRTIATTAPTADYTAAQQAADFGGAEPVVYVRIYQLSAVVGRGTVLEGSI